MLRKAEVLERVQLRQSTIKDWLNCPLMYRYRHIEGLKPAFRNPAALHGSALHLAIHRLHLDGFDQDVGQLYRAAFDELRSEEAEIPIRWKLGELADLETLQVHGEELLAGYVGSMANRTAQVLYSEVRFRVRIKGYELTGTIDQVRQDPSGAVDLIDLKSSQQRPNQRALPMDWQLSLYAYALRYGELLVGGSWIRSRIQVDRTVIYFLRAHERYKRNSKYGRKGDEKGNPLLACGKPAWDLKRFRGDLINLLKMMTWDWPFPNPSACGFCAYSQRCHERGLYYASARIRRVTRELVELGMLDNSGKEYDEYDNEDR